MTMRLAYGSALGVGSPPATGEELEQVVSTACTGGWDALLSLRARGEVGFMDLPSQDLSLIHQVAQEARGMQPRWLLVVGIGGSSLGLEASAQALAPYLPPGSPELRLLDNVDAEKTAKVLEEVDLSKAVVNVVSKSGGTAESMANFLVVFHAMCRRIGESEARRRVFFTTDPSKGTLRELAKELGIRALPVPPSVGGRFSVLSAVGLFPLSLLGLPVEPILNGAGWMLDLCLSSSGIENPALLLAGLHLLLNQKGKTIAVMMPYLGRLEGFSRWFCQLWAESLGKQGRGQTPLAALGANDQHSLIQLFNDGPKDKMVTFLRVERPEAEVEIPAIFQKDSLAYLGGSSLHTLLLNEQVATAAALTKSGVPNLTLSIERLEPFTLGALFMLYQLATAVAGLAMGINPFDQPGVEQGKRFTYGLMRRRGFEKEAREVKRYHAADRAVLELKED